MKYVDTALELQVLDIAQLSGKRTYIITARRMTSGDELERLNGERLGVWSPYPRRSLRK